MKDWARTTPSSEVNKDRKGSFVYEGEPVNFTFWLRGILPALKASDDDEYLAALADTLISWDLQGDDGQPYPITAETLADLPEDFIDALTGEIGRAAQAFAGRYTGR